MKKWYFILFFIAAIGISVAQETNEVPGLNIYPNPVTQGVVYIATDSNQTKEIVIYDVFGAMKLRTTIDQEALYLQNLEAGIYVIRVTENNRTSTRKLIVK
jgi:hypothetical protein